VGFVDAASVVLPAPSAAPGTSSAPPAAGSELSLPGDPPAAGSMNGEDRATPRSRSGKDRSNPYVARIKALGGYNFFSVKDVNTLLSSDLLKYGWNLGAEAQVFIGSLLVVTARFERLQCSAFARDSSQSHVYQIDSGAWSALGGLELTVASTGKVSVHIGALAGMGLSQTITATDLSSAAPNVTTMSSKGFAGLAKLDVHYQATSALGLFLEGGYRLQKSPPMQPTDSPNGSQIFKDQTSGLYVPVTLDYSGPFGGGGLSISF
jgi:hypothetical protein